MLPDIYDLCGPDSSIDVQYIILFSISRGKGVNIFVQQALFHTDYTFLISAGWGPQPRKKIKCDYFWWDKSYQRAILFLADVRASLSHFIEGTTCGEAADCSHSVLFAKKYRDPYFPHPPLSRSPACLYAWIIHENAGVGWDGGGVGDGVLGTAGHQRGMGKLGWDRVYRGI